MVINSPCLIDNKELAIPGQTTTVKELSNPLMADSLPKTILPTKLVKSQGKDLLLLLLQDNVVRLNLLLLQVNAVRQKLTTASANYQEGPGPMSCTSVRLWFQDHHVVIDNVKSAIMTTGGIYHWWLGYNGLTMILEVLNHEIPRMQFWEWCGSALDDLGNLDFLDYG
ncbi:hypothetical protein Tco_0044529 [Tanacetum coccineum]